MLSLSLSWPAIAEESSPAAMPRSTGPIEDAYKIRTNKTSPTTPGNMVWSFGLNGARNFLRSKSGRQILGSHGAVQFGAGYVAKNWFTFGSFDFLTGPFEPVTVGQLDVDYVGTGLSFWSGISPKAEGMRSGGISYGLACGVSYSDLVGRSIGRGQRNTSTLAPDTDPQNDSSVDSYVLQTTNVSIIPGLFISWLKSPRPAGNSPDLLSTRLEGALLTLGMAVPLTAEFSKKMVLVNGALTAEKGTMKGYRVELTWTALLGP